MQTLIDFLGSADFIPHGYCLRWSSLLLWLHVVSDTVITISYYSIPLSLFYFVRQRQNLPYRWLIHLTALFIIACGTTHFISLITIWLPIYWLDGYVKAFTAIISLVTAVLMVRIIPIALQLPTAEQLQQEIAERLQAQKTLESANTRFNALFNNMPNGVAVYEAVEDGNNFVFRDFNRAGEVLDGVKREDLLGKSVTDVFPSVELFGLLAVMRRVWQTGQAEHMPTSMYSDGRLSVYRENYVYRLPSGEVVAVYEDVTAQKKAQQAQQEAAERLEKIANQLPSVVFQFCMRANGSFCVPYASDMVRKIYRVSPEDIRDDATPIFAHVHPDDLSRHIDGIKISAAQLSPWCDEYRLRFADGIDLWLMGSALPQRQPDGSTLWHGSVTDITETKQAQQVEQQQHALLLNVINSLSHPFYVVNTDDYTVLLANKSAGEWIKGKTTCYQLSHHQNFRCLPSQGHPCPIEEVKRTKKPLVVQHLHVDANGSPRTVEIFAYPIFNDTGDVHQMIEYVIDVTARVQTEQQLKKSEVRFRHTFENAPIGVLNVALNGRFLAVNQTYCDLLGYSREELLTMTVADVTLEQDKLEHSQLMQQLLAGEIASFCLEKQYVRKDSSLVWGGLSVQLSHHADCLVDYFIATVENIDERKRVQNEIIAANNQLQATLDAIPDLLFELDNEGYYVNYHAPHTELLAAPPEQFLGKNVTEILPTAAAAICLSALHEARQQSWSAGKQIQLKLAQGTHWFELSVAIKPTNNKQEPHFIVLSRDVTERKMSETALRASEQKFRLLIEQMPLALGLASSTGELIYINDRFKNTFGYTLAEIPTVEQWYVRAYPDANYRQQVITTWTAAIEHAAQHASDIEPAEYRVTCKNGEVRIMVISGMFFENNLLATFVDITERQQMEAELKRSNAELEQFAYAVSHDMRQPLRMVTSYLSLIEQALKNQLDDETRQFLHFAVDGAKRMDAMILSLLDYSRVGRKTTEIARISSRMALEEALAFLEPELKASNGTVDVSGEWLELRASRDELTRLFQNLIGNALKYHDKNTPSHVEVHAQATKQVFRVTVRDFGIGIDPKQIDRLFKVFSRLQARSQFEGTGVGLALCRKIVEHHGGKIGVESAGEGQGSVFWFELPIVVA